MRKFRIRHLGGIGYAIQFQYRFLFFKWWETYKVEIFPNDGEGRAIKEGYRIQAMMAQKKSKVIFESTDV